MTRRRLLVVTVFAVLIAAAAFGGYRVFGRTSTLSSSATAPTVPTARVTRGSMTLTVHLQGDLRATRQMNLTAPAVGGTLRILNLVGTGTAVAKDDAVMEFDPSDQQYALEQAEFDLQEAEQEIIKRRAEIRAQEAQDKVALLTAQFDVRRATLDAAVDADLISANDHKIRQAELAEATRNLARLEQDIVARSVTARASLKVLEEKKGRADMAAARARQNMENLVLRSPMDGVLAVRDNMDANSGFFYEGMSLPAYRAGDTVYSGRPIVDVYDMSTMEIRTRVGEQERANVEVGQSARIEADAVPGFDGAAKVSSVAGIGRPDNRMGPLRQFDISLELVEPDPRLKPGTTVRVLLQGKTVDNVLIVPRQALFEVDGKPTVYARGAGETAFTPRQVKVLHRSESRVAVEGIDEGVDVALVDPLAAMKLGSGQSVGGPLGVQK